MVSIVVLAGNNLKYVKACLTSIFCQTYNEIELIISYAENPGFDEIGIITFINQQKKDNIKRVLINKYEKQIGLVKQCNRAIKSATGVFIIFITCDEIFANENIMGLLVNEIKIAIPDSMGVVAQYEVCNEDLSQPVSIYIGELTNQFDCRTFYERCWTQKWAFLFASSIFKRECFERLGEFDETYYSLINWQTTKNNKEVHFNYLNNVCVKKRIYDYMHNDLFNERMYHFDLIKISKEFLKDKNLKLEERRKIKENLLELKTYYNKLYGSRIK